MPNGRDDYNTSAFRVTFFAFFGEKFDDGSNDRQQKPNGFIQLCRSRSRVGSISFDSDG